MHRETEGTEYRKAQLGKGLSKYFSAEGPWRGNSVFVSLKEN
jgi:hypothetical protein